MATLKTKTSGEIADLFDLDPQTLRNWCDTVKEFLSDGAVPGNGAHRRFTDADVGILSLVHQMREDGLSLGEIYASLKNNKTNVPPTALEITLKQNPEMAVTMLRGRLMEIETQLVNALDELERLKGADARAELLNKQLEASQAEVARLNREIGRLEGKAKD